MRLKMEASDAFASCLSGELASEFDPFSSSSDSSDSSCLGWRRRRSGASSHSSDSSCLGWRDWALPREGFNTSVFFPETIGIIGKPIWYPETIFRPSGAGWGYEWKLVAQTPVGGVGVMPPFSPHAPPFLPFYHGDLVQRLQVVAFARWQERQNPSEP